MCSVVSRVGRDTVSYLTLLGLNRPLVCILMLMSKALQDYCRSSGLS